MSSSAEAATQATQPIEPEYKSSDAVTIVKGDIFAAPAGSVLIHACNPHGIWGGGIAAAFRARYPAAHKAYVSHCESHTNEELMGTCQLIPASEADPPHTVACLYTADLGPMPKEEILAYTEISLQDLQRQHTEGSEMHACMFNSGIFGVPWAETQKVVDKVGLHMIVYESPVKPKVLPDKDDSP